jgi:hypothetical protein
MEISFSPAPSSFCLMGAAATYKVVIEDMRLYIKRSHIAAGVLNAHRLTNRTQSFKWPLQRVQIYTNTISTGLTSHVITNLFPDQTPKSLIIGFVENVSTTGAFDKNPYNFKHFDVSNLQLQRASKQYPLQPYKQTWGPRAYGRAYYDLMKFMGRAKGNDVLNISLDEYAKGSTLFASTTSSIIAIAIIIKSTSSLIVDLKADSSSTSEGTFDVVTHDPVSLHLTFGTPLTTTVTCVMYAVFDNMMEIWHNGRVRCFVVVVVVVLYYYAFLQITMDNQGR